MAGRPWAIPGVLFVLAGTVVLLNGYLALLSTGRGRGARFGSRILYALFFSWSHSGPLLCSCRFLMMLVGEFQMLVACNGSNISASAPLYPWTRDPPKDLREEIIAPEDVRTFPQGESILFQAKPARRAMSVSLVV